MTKKKRELIDILLDNVKPEDWPENLPFAAQDTSTFRVFFYSQEPKISGGRHLSGSGESYYSFEADEICEHWNKTIVHRDEFMKRWNERNAPVEVKTPQQLALEKFGTDWHENEGVQPVDDEVLVDVMFFDETEPYTADPASIWGWRVERKSSSEIKKWRIHSDDKESQIYEKEKALESIMRPMPPCSEEIPCRFVDVKEKTYLDKVDGEFVAKKVISENFESAKEAAGLGEYKITFKAFSIKPQSATETQIGGDHYTKLAIQPMQYSMENGLDALQHTVIKYVTRFRDKNGIEDLEKAKHCIDMLIEFEKESK